MKQNHINVIAFYLLLMINNAAMAMTPSCTATNYDRNTGITNISYAFGNWELTKAGAYELCTNGIKPTGFTLNFLVDKMQTSILFQKWSNGVIDSDGSVWTSQISPTLNDWERRIFDNNIELFEKHAPLLLKQANEAKQAKQKEQDEALAKLDKEKAVLKEIEDTKQKEVYRVATIQLLNSVAKMNAGQLFAKADELSSQGDKAKAREVLRSLVSRFPDHPLAATAAQQMAALANAGNIAPASENAGRQAGGGQAGGNSGGSGNVCNGQVPAFIKEKWGRFSRPDMREVYSGTVKPLAQGLSDAIKIMGSKSAAVRDFDANLTNWKSEIVVAADGYCKIQTGCSNPQDLLKTWPQALPANFPNSSGPSASESLAGAYVAMGIGIDYFTALKQYAQCSGS